jgi:hypothetical protein
VEDRPGRSRLSEALQPRYAGVPVDAGLYESLYFTAHHPTEPQALWVRHTVLKPPGGPPRASLWCTWFGGGAGGVRAAKVTTPVVSTTDDRALEIGDHGWIGPGGAAGAVDLDTLQARWNVEFRDPEAPFPHLPRPWMYRAPLPRTKSISASPQLTLAGHLVADGETIDVSGWPCTIGHNWGAEHAERWIWIHADADADAHAGAADGFGPVWLDAIVGQVRLGRVTTPWIANGAVSIAGHRHRLGGLRHGVATPVTVHDRSATVVLRGSGITVEARADLELQDCVAWAYADPAGHAREVVNSSVARAHLTIGRPGGAAVEATAPASAFELGARRRAFDVPLQPFAD